jgi:two-component system cell cycle response regulator
MKILSVDDSKTIRMIVKRTFAPFDCTVLEACNGAEGLTAAAVNPTSSCSTSPCR